MQDQLAITLVDKQGHVQDIALFRKSDEKLCKIVPMLEYMLWGDSDSEEPTKHDHIALADNWGDN